MLTEAVHQLRSELPEQGPPVLTVSWYPENDERAGAAGAQLGERKKTALTIKTLLE